MKCYLKPLTCAVNFFLLFNFSFSLELKKFIEKVLKENFGDEIKLVNYKPVSKEIPKEIKNYELKLFKNSPRGFIYVKNSKVYTIIIEVNWKCELLVAERDIKKEERLRNEYVKFVSKYMKKCPSKLNENILNFVAKREIKKGEVIEKRHLKKEFLVKRGETVRVIYEDENIYITFETKALDGGFYGEKIRVLSPFSKKVITGRVIDENTVKIP